jgi:3-dehydroquinate synthase
VLEDGAAVTVAAAAGGYPVLVRRGLMAKLGELVADRVGEVRRWAVVSDDVVAPLHGERARASLDGAGLPASLHTFPAGEAHKTRATWAALTDDLLASGLGRDGGVVAVGGGVTGDLAGFVAATYMRGIPVVQVPTSVLAMVDSAIGGKTGVDTPAGKNLVGAFHAPRLVVVDPEAVATLPRRERAQGWCEAVKHGAILDDAYLSRLERDVAALLDGAADAVERAVRRSVELKAEVVGRDEREGGLREILNFGHTLGHALEAASGYALPHGSAVSLGMVLEARLGERLGASEPGTAERLARVLGDLGLPTIPPAGLGAGPVMAALERDKKVREGRVRVVLLERPGVVSGAGGWARPVDRALALDVLAEASREAGFQA